MPRHHYKERYAVYIGTTTPFTSERLRRLWWNWHSAHFGMATPFGRNLHPYDIHELVTDGEMSVILRELHEDHKFLLFLSALRQYSSAKIAAIRGQTDRNIRKVRNTMLKKIRKKLLAALTEKVQAQQPLTLLEKEFLSENGVDVENGNKS